MGLPEQKLELQNRVMGLLFGGGEDSPYTSLTREQFESTLDSNLSDLLNQDETYEKDRGLETIPHMLKLPGFIEYHLNNSDYLSQDYFTKSQYSIDQWNDMMQIGALLHDTGKNHIDKLLLGRRGDLTDEEKEIVKEHAIATREFLVDLKMAEPIISIGTYHHERKDGTGYPFKLNETLIPKEAVVVGFWDTVYAVLTRKYFSDTQPELKSPDEAIDYIQKLAPRFPNEMMDFLVTEYKKGDYNQMYTMINELFYSHHPEYLPGLKLDPAMPIDQYTATANVMSQFKTAMLNKD